MRPQRGGARPKKSEWPTTRTTMTARKSCSMRLATQTLCFRAKSPNLSPPYSPPVIWWPTPAGVRQQRLRRSQSTQKSPSTAAATPCWFTHSGTEITSTSVPGALTRAAALGEPHGRFQQTSGAPARRSRLMAAAMQWRSGGGLIPTTRERKKSWGTATSQGLAGIRRACPAASPPSQPGLHAHTASRPVPLAMSSRSGCSLTAATPKAFTPAAMWRALGACRIWLKTVPIGSARWLLR